MIRDSGPAFNSTLRGGSFSHSTNRIAVRFQPTEGVGRSVAQCRQARETQTQCSLSLTFGQAVTDAPSVNSGGRPFQRAARGVAEG